MIPRSGEPPVFSADDMIGGFNWSGSLPADPEELRNAGGAAAAAAPPRR